MGTTTAGNESLAYLFDDDTSVVGKTVRNNVSGLFQVDNTGYYYFDSNKTGAQLNPDNSFTLIDFADGLLENSTGFFPFNTLDKNGQGYVKSDGTVINNTTAPNGVKESEDINHFFGAHMTTQFVQSEDGLTKDGQTHVTYEFVGDDDVWIFIDGILVGDVGGIHNPAQVRIDFATGDISYFLNADADYPTEDTEHASNLLQQYINALPTGSVQYCIRTAIFDGKSISDIPTEGNTPYGANIAKVTNGANTHIFQKLFKEDGTPILDDDGNYKWTFADGTYHTLDFFFLERGAGGSNMNLQFNLEEIPPTYIHKVDQDGNPIADVQFELWVVRPTNDTEKWDTNTDKTNITDVEKVATGTTDADGMLTLRYSENMGAKADKMASLADIFTSYQQYTVNKVISSGGLEYENALLLELREAEETGKHSAALAGYRHAEATSLRLENINGTYILRSNDRWNNGVYATPLAVVSAPEEIKSFDIRLVPDPRDREPTIIHLSDQEYDGKVGLFAVVLAWVGKGTPTMATIGVEENWAPVYGSPETGWTIEKLKLDEYDKDYAKALGAAIGEYARRNKGSTDGFIYPFEPTASGSYNAEINNLPGEIDSYYFMIADQKGNIGDFDGDGQVDENLTAEQQAELDAKLAKIKYTTTFYFSTADDPEQMDGNQTFRIDHRGSGFQRNFGATIGVPNIQNRLMVQRLDAQGNTICDAEFALYKQEAVDEDTLTLKAGAQPVYKANHTSDLEQGVLGSHVTLGGGTAFHGLPTGVYYLQETQAPVGYAPNKRLVKVIVDENGVHAYAGQPLRDDAGAEVIDTDKGVAKGDGDGISVLVGVGRLVSTMANFGSAGMIDTTLTDIYALRAKGTETDGKLSWEQVNTKDYNLQRKWRVYDENAAMQYSTADPETDILGNPNTLDDKENPYGYVSASGWNWDLITQNYYGIYDPGMHYSELLKELNKVGNETKLAAINDETRTKTALPTLESDEQDDKFDTSNGYTSFGNKILNGLFSGSTIVRVASTAVGDLVISKQVSDAPAARQASQPFNFSIGFTYDAPEVTGSVERPRNTIGDIDMTPELAGEYAYTITNGGTATETGTLTIDKDAAGTGYHIATMTAGGATPTHFDAATHGLKLAGGETITIKELPRAQNIPWRRKLSSAMSKA